MTMPENIQRILNDSKLSYYDTCEEVLSKIYQEDEWDDVFEINLKNLSITSILNYDDLISLIRFILQNEYDEPLDIYYFDESTKELLIVELYTNINFLLAFIVGTFSIATIIVVFMLLF